MSVTDAEDVNELVEIENISELENQDNNQDIETGLELDTSGAETFEQVQTTVDVEEGVSEDLISEVKRSPTRETGRSGTTSPIPTVYRTELCMPLKSPEQYNQITEQNPPQHLITARPINFSQRRKNKISTIEDFPRVDINSRVKYFEAEIEKENEGIQRLRQEAVNRDKHKKDNAVTWDRESYSKCSHGQECWHKNASSITPIMGEKCNARNCPEGRTTTQGEYTTDSFTKLTNRINEGGNRVNHSMEGSTSVIPFKEKKGQSYKPSKVDSRTSPNSAMTNGESSSGFLEDVKPVIPKKTLSMDEATSTAQSMTSVALNSQALVYSKNILEIPELLNSNSFHQELSAAGRNLIVVIFYTPWCRPCKLMAPIFLELANVHRDVKFFQVNVDNVAIEGILEEFDVGHIPSFVIFRDSAKIAKIEGQTEKSTLEKWIQRSK